VSALFSICHIILTRPFYNRLPPTLIHVLNDDCLLRIFSLYRPPLLDEDEAFDICILQEGEWGRERWWYKLAHVCRRWRYLILQSAAHLGVCLVCTYGTPVADMLAHSPPLPLVIDAVGNFQDISAEDEERITFALQHADRVRRIRVRMPVSKLQKLILVMDKEFPILEYLYIAPPTKHDTTIVFPQTFRAPQLRQLILINLATSIGSPLIATAAGLVTLALDYIHPSAYFSPHELLVQLSLMPQLETLGITFHSPSRGRALETQLSETPITQYVTLPHLRWFTFGGDNAYLEALLPHVTTSLLERLQIIFFNRLSFSVPCLLQFMGTAERLRFSSLSVSFLGAVVVVRALPREGDKVDAFYMHVSCQSLDWQVACAAQIFDTIGSAFTSVKRLHLQFGERESSSEGDDVIDVDLTDWRVLLGSFNNGETLLIDDGLIKDLSLSLQWDDGEPPLDLLPQLKELVYSANGDVDDAFTSFIRAREVAGHSVSLVRR